jgi:hypothetical protein
MPPPRSPKHLRKKVPPSGQLIRLPLNQELKIYI